MKYVQLTRNQQAIVDDDDFEWLLQWKWYAEKSKVTYYAARNDGSKGKHALARMSREILKRQGINLDGFEVDHKDRNGLNNQKNNLRKCTHIENMRNSTRKPKKCLYKGLAVYYGTKKRWFARIQVNRKFINGPFRLSQEEAARDYDSMALKHHGEFARLNFPQKDSKI